MEIPVPDLYKLLKKRVIVIANEVKQSRFHKNSA